MMLNKEEFIVEMARVIATMAHINQKRWDGKEYITHPEFIAGSFADLKLKAIAWLHDVIEDSDYTAMHLRNFGIPSDIVNPVVVLTKLKDENYLNYILRVREFHSATKVKLADLKHNLSNLKKGSMRDKYIMAEWILHNTVSDDKRGIKYG